MTTGADVRQIKDVVELLQASELSEIRYYQIAGVRVERPDGEPVRETGQDLKVQVGGDANGLETRVLMTVSTEEANLAAEVGALYSFEEPLEIPQPVIAEFIEKVGVMAVFPFLRESVFTTATRLGVPAPVIGLLRAGELHVEAPDSEASESTAGVGGV
ncbi:hypothetical protein [Cellulomonas sp. KRMCY2]|uniref:hypothetical protein n=1 Tax=Cellulomonas sp. KRMCY2 TaxID=1304865 RepID=UPI00045E8435|nr:hypothetical protein [Cellulomonas sp. KRMCY2]